MTGSIETSEADGVDVVVAAPTNRLPGVKSVSLFFLTNKDGIAVELAVEGGGVFDYGATVFGSLLRGTTREGERGKQEGGEDSALSVHVESILGGQGAPTGKARRSTRFHSNAV